MTLLLLYWGIMILCYLLAGRLAGCKDKFGFVSGALNVVIYILVFVMGLRMGANEEVTSSLGTIGLQSLLITGFTVAGSMLAVTVLRKVLRLNREGQPMYEEGEPEKPAEQNLQQEGGSAKTTVLILLCVAVGMLMGYLVIPRIFTDIAAFQEKSGNLLIVGICLLLGLVGFNLGLEGDVIKNLKNAGSRIILFPLAAIAGSLLLGSLYGLISPLTVREAAAVSAGFGWYTFAPSVIAEAGHEVAGAVSFMHNIIRETLGIIIIPLAAKKFGFIESTAIPGVAAMDICLPIVEKSCRAETVMYSLCMGMMMSAAVPLLVPLIIG